MKHNLLTAATATFDEMIAVNPSMLPSHIHRDFVIEEFMDGVIRKMKEAGKIEPFSKTERSFLRNYYEMRKESQLETEEHETEENDLVRDDEWAEWLDNYGGEWGKSGPTIWQIKVVCREYHEQMVQKYNLIEAKAPEEEVDETPHYLVSPPEEEEEKKVPQKNPTPYLSIDFQFPNQRANPGGVRKLLNDIGDQISIFEPASQEEEINIISGLMQLTTFLISNNIS